MRALPLVTFLVLAGLTVGVWAVSRHQATTRLELQSRLTCEQVALRLEEGIRARVAVAEALRELIGAGDVGEDSFRKHVLAMQGRFPGLLAVNWVDATGVIRRVVPAEPNAPALGRDLRSHPKVGATVSACIADGRDRFSPPLELYQGGLGFTGYLPVRRGDRLVAILNPVFRTSALLERVLSGGLGRTFSYRVWDGDRLIYERTIPGTPEGKVQPKQAFMAGNRSWTFELRPGPELVAAARSPGSNVGALLGLIAALTLSLLLRAQIAAAEERRALLGHLDRRQRLETLGTLAGGVAHEYNNHLTALLGFVETAARSLPTEADTARDCLEQSRAVIERSRQVVDQILTFARRRELVKHQVRVAPVVSEVGRLFRTTLPDSVELLVKIEIDERVTVLGDSGRIHQVLTNLISNAAQALEPEGGGTIMLSATRSEVGAGKVDPPNLPPGPYVELLVRDDGPGIAPDVRDRLFEPFFTTKSTGTGLGLSVTHGIVAEHEGEILVDSEVGRGTTMRVLLPCTVAEPEAVSPQPERPTPSASRVLLVEDDAMVRSMLVTVLSEADITVTPVATAEEALETVGNGTFDLVLTDDGLPGLSGTELGAELRRLHPDLQLVLMSGRPPDSEEELEELGFQAFMPKPFDMDTLLATLDQLPASRA